MNPAADGASHTGRPVRSHPGALRWILAAALAGPATIVIHELGHYGAGRLAGRTDLELRHASVSRRADMTDHAAWLTGGGLLVSWGLTLVCALRARRRPAPLVVATGVGSALKSAPCPVFVLAWLVGRRHPDSHLDEVVLAQQLGLPEVAGTAAGALVFLGGSLWLLARVDGAERRAALVGLALGFGVGIPTWLGVVGPRLMG